MGKPHRITDGLQHRDPGPAPSTRAAGRARPQQEDPQERMGKRRAPSLPP